MFIGAVRNNLGNFEVQTEYVLKLGTGMLTLNLTFFLNKNAFDAYNSFIANFDTKEPCFLYPAPYSLEVGMYLR